MSAVEEIETAIAKLTELRDATFATPWEIDGKLIRSDGWILAEIFKAGNESTSQLIVTLHRTIDAQLAILTGTLSLHAKFSAADREAEWLSAVERAGDLALARAINGAA